MGSQSSCCVIGKAELDQLLTLSNASFCEEVACQLLRLGDEADIDIDWRKEDRLLQQLQAGRIHLPARAAHTPSTELYAEPLQVAKNCGAAGWAFCHAALRQEKLDHARAK